MKNKDLPVLHDLMSVFPCSGLPLEKIKSVLKFHKEIKQKDEDYRAVRKNIFLSHDIKNDEDYAKSKDIEIVTKQIEDLDNEEIKIPKGFLTEDEVLNSVTNMRGITVTGTSILIDALEE